MLINQVGQPQEHCGGQVDLWPGSKARELLKTCMELAAVWDNATHNHTKTAKNKLGFGGGFGYPWLVSKHLGKVLSITVFLYLHLLRNVLL